MNSIRVLFLVFAFSAFLNGGMVRAADATQDACSPVDLSQSPRMPPVRDQGDIGWCYASVAADLLSYKLGKEVSYIDTGLSATQSYLYAIQHHSDGPLTELDDDGVHDDIGTMYKKGFALGVLGNENGGASEDAIRSVINGGVCFESNFDPKRKGLDDGDNQKILEILQNMELHAKLARLHRTRIPVGACELQVVQSIFPNIDTNDLYQALIDAADSKLPRITFVLELKKKNCKKRDRIQTNLQVFSMEADSPGNLKEAMSRLNQELGRKNMVGVGIRAHLDNLNADLSQGGGHEVSIIGRRRAKNGSCEYLLRNSWGFDACTYRDPKTHKRLYDPSLDCKDGNVWVPQASFQKMLMDILYIR